MASFPARLRTGAWALLALGLAACGEAQPVTLRFAAVAGGAPLTCDSPAADGAALTDMRFYIHDVVLLTAEDREVPLRLDPAPPWQNPAVALIDLEDGRGGCETGSAAVHTAITGTIAEGHYTGLRFTVGVPFALNHADPAVAQPPLDQTALHWHWQAGYKFMRAGLRRGDQHSYLHLGATGCQGRIGAVMSCARPNRVAVTLASFDPTADTVGIDLGALFSEAAGACQSEPDNAACTDMLAHLGLGDRPQDIFHRVGPD